MLQQLFASFSSAPQVSDPSDPRLEHVSFGRIKKFLRKNGLSKEETEKANSKFVLCMLAQRKNVSLEPLLAEATLVMTNVYACTADIHQADIDLTFRAPVTTWLGQTEYGTYTGATVGLVSEANAQKRDAALDELSQVLQAARDVGVPTASLKMPNQLERALVTSKTAEYQALEEAKAHAAATTAKNATDAVARRISEGIATCEEVVYEVWSGAVKLVEDKRAAIAAAIEAERLRKIAEEEERLRKIEEAENNAVKAKLEEAGEVRCTLALAPLLPCPPRLTRA